MIVGYVRVSKQEQNFFRQIDALTKYGIDERNIYKEKITGTKKDRPQLIKMINELKENDTVVVVDLTRISRSTKDLLDIVEKIKNKGANIKSLKDTWLDTTDDNPYSNFLLTVMAGLSQLERDLISQRTKEGLASARARGRLGGRRPLKDEKVNRALMLYDMKTICISDICEMCNISKSSLYNYIRKRKSNP